MVFVSVLQTCFDAYAVCCHVVCYLLFHCDATVVKLRLQNHRKQQKMVSCHADFAWRSARRVIGGLIVFWGAQVFLPFLGPQFYTLTTGCNTVAQAGTVTGVAAVCNPTMSLVYRPDVHMWPLTIAVA